MRFDDPEGEQLMPEVLPMIVIVVDEFADLMMQQGKEVEVCVARLAQKARAAGMHVILATQRPSRRRHHRHDQGELPDAHRVSAWRRRSTRARSSTSRAPSTCSAAATCSSS